jgi:hypothetical protein
MKQGIFLRAGACASVLHFRALRIASRNQPCESNGVQGDTT